MTTPLGSSAVTEEARIRSAYARRPKDDRYSWFSPGHLFLMQERERWVLETLRREGFSSLEGKTILEIGCGTGYWLREFIKWGARPADITGLDLLPDRVTEARTLCPAGVRIECANATEAALPDKTFDLVVQSTVFTSILDPHARRRVASEMLRVVKPDGLILWYDFHVNNPRNPDVRGIAGHELRNLFPECHVGIQRMTLAPPLLRQVARYSWLLSYLLSGIPWLCTHHLAVIRKQ
jgi:ubiquinone/menaquinone biosynthesis C-methylase UbiE